MNIKRYKRKVYFEKGHNCIDFECNYDQENCYPESGGSHGVHGLEIRFVVTGKKGAVQFLLFTGWKPYYIKAEPYSGRGFLSRDYGGIVLPADLGYHSKKPLFKEQASMGSCEFLNGKKCYYDGSSLNGGDAFYTLVNAGEEALWTFLEEYYESVFEGKDYPQVKEYKKPLRKGTT